MGLQELNGGLLDSDDARDGLECGRIRSSFESSGSGVEIVGFVESDALQDEMGEETRFGRL